MTSPSLPRVFAEAVGLRVTLPALLRTLPLDRVLQLVTPGRPRARAARGKGALVTIEKATDALTRWFRPTRTACMSRALMRYVLLRRHGFDARFFIGVRPGGGDGFEAHAWVTLDDVPVMEREPVHCRPTFVWPRTT